ncbi:MAG: hypothetical protein H7144_08960, partial [Burkholderiales bacterium]|nr:hypothetical protein [Phycisphaerae bacterium]
ATLQIGNGGSTGTLGTGAVAIAAGGKLNFNRSDAITIANNLTGSVGTVRMTGSGSTTLTGTNTVGNAEVLSGTLVLGSATALPAGVAIAVHGGMLDLRGNSGTISSLSGNAPGGAVTDQSAGAGTTTLTINGSTTTDFYGGINNGATRTLALAKAGTGTIKLRGASNFSGGTSITQGFIDAYHNQALGTGTIVINPGGSNARLTLASGVTLANPITVTTSNSAPATGTLQSLDNATAAFSGAIAINGSAASGGHFAGPMTSGLLTFSGAITAPDGITLVSRQGNIAMGGGGSYTGLDVRSGKLTLSASNGVAPNAVLDLAGNGATGTATIFDLGGFNQTLKGLKNAVNNTFLAQVTNTGVAASTLSLNVGAGNTQSFGGSISGNLNLSVTSGTQVLTKTGAGGTANGIYTYTGSTTVSGGTLQLERTHTNHAGYTVSGGTLQVNGAISPTGTAALLVATGAGAIVIGAIGTVKSSTLNAVAPITNNGVLATTLGGSIGGLNGTGSLTVSGGTLIATTGILQTGLTIGTGAELEIAANGLAAGVTKIKTLDIAMSGADYTGTLQLHDNDLIIDYTGVDSPYAQTLSMVKKGLLILGGNGQGIASSEVDAQTLSGTMLAVVDSGEVSGQIDSLSGFAGIPNDSVLVKYTWRGDTNLDGVVNGSDYALADTGFSGGTSGGWFYGDVNYDGAVNGSDYALIDTGFSSQSGPLPEPASLGALAVSALCLLRRVRRGEIGDKHQMNFGKIG